MNPPKILTEASMTARKPSAVENVNPAVAAGRDQRADDDDRGTALVTLINGECSAGVTRQTT